ncbi:(2Fe-2S)-binding protein [Halarcobacter ebronensis]|uniref:(2Fe-2S)-binding protein n=1 Tax=Halarcobacter ebronensis TaxID=1462615 RepID=A0A4Q1AN88_9BACT|nr:(2Fe-2S)-binding protein [Halarcobacter ebronensis]QKF82198.1 BFD-like [2Fe-2S]-binding domain-containing protein [Halarcobacter ebronensis]RXK03424.1 (2Fe-2S)-binding protein [Halarcobacter ebronensis]
MLKDFEDSYEVCTCKKIKLKELLKVIEEKNLKTLGAIQEFTLAGTQCRNCIMAEADFGKIKKRVYLKDILKEVLNG